MDQAQIIVATCTFLVCWYLFHKRSSLPKPRPGTRHPPCLLALPVVGSLPFLKSSANDVAHQFMEKSTSLGSVFALYFASKYVVVLNGTDAIREALLKKSSQFASRMPFYIESSHNNVNLKGVINSLYNDTFRQKHQLYLSILKRFGFGQRLMETRISANVEEFIREATSAGGQPSNPAAALEQSVMNIIAGIIFGPRFSYGHPTLIKLIHQIHKWVTNVLLQLDFFPLLRFVPPFRKRMIKALTDHSTLINTIDETLTDVLQTEQLTPKDDENDSFIRQFIESTEYEGVSETTMSTASLSVAKQSPDVVAFDREELVYTIRDLLTGGSDTSVTTLRWFLMMMANHPEAQTRMQGEVDDVVGRDRPPSLADEQSMPYSQAVMLETMRRYTLLPLTLFHSTTCDTAVGDFFVPANTLVIVNLYSAHMNSTAWRNPTAFTPERFLENGAVFGKDRILSFSLGKRSCLGELLARQELFLFMTGIVQNFDIRTVEGVQQINDMSKSPFFCEPQPFEIRLIPRCR